MMLFLFVACLVPLAATAPASYYTTKTTPPLSVLCPPWWEFIECQQTGYEPHCTTDMQCVRSKSDDDPSQFCCKNPFTCRQECMPIHPHIVCPDPDWNAKPCGITFSECDDDSDCSAPKICCLTQRSCIWRCVHGNEIPQW